MEGEITFSRNPAQYVRHARERHVATQKGPAKLPALRISVRPDASISSSARSASPAPVRFVARRLRR